MSVSSKIARSELTAMADRLRALRETTGMTQEAFAEHVGLSYTQWGNLEAAHSRIGIDAAIQLVRVTKVTLGWIYLGEDAWLPLELSRKIADALGNPTTKRGPRRKPEA